MAKGKEAAVLDNHRAELLRLKQLRNKKGSYRRDKVFEVPKGLGIAWIAQIARLGIARHLSSPRDCGVGMRAHGPRWQGERLPHLHL